MSDGPTRIACIAPGCGRGIGREAWMKRFGDVPTENAEYCCQNHWSSVPPAMRKVYARVRRRERRFGMRLPAGQRLWARLRREILRGTA